MNLSAHLPIPPPNPLTSWDNRGLGAGGEWSHNYDMQRSCKGQAVRQAIRDAQAHLLFLPPYSPDLNPIEQVFSKLKHMLRNAAERTIEATWRRIGSLLDCFSPQECKNYIANAR